MFRVDFDELSAEFIEFWFGACEGHCDVINFIFQSELDDVVLVELTNGRQVDVHSGHAHVLLVPQLAVVQDLHCHDPVLHLAHHRGHPSVCEEDLLPHPC